MADDQEPGLDAILKKLSPEDAKQLMRIVVETAMDAVEARIPGLFGSVRDMLGYTDTVLAEVEDLTNKTGDTREDVLLKALILYEAAVDATQKGQRLVLVEPDYRFIREIVGIGRDDRVHTETEKVAG